MTEQNDTVMSVADVARHLKCAPSTVYELIARGDLPAKRLGRARGVRISTRAFYAWLDSPDNRRINDGE
jgi:excisionase family DNA binding protein